MAGLGWVLWLALLVAWRGRRLRLDVYLSWKSLSEVKNMDSSTRLLVLRRRQGDCTVPHFVILYCVLLPYLTEHRPSLPDQTLKPNRDGCSHVSPRSDHSTHHTKPSKYHLRPYKDSDRVRRVDVRTDRSRRVSVVHPCVVHFTSGQKHITVG